MSEQRLSLAFCCAFFLHLLFVLAPSPVLQPLAPQLTGNTSIKITLASTSVRPITAAVAMEDLQEEVQPPPPQQEEEVVEEVTPEEKISEIVPEEPEKDDPILQQLQPASKQPVQSETTAEHSPASKTETAEPVVESVEKTVSKDTAGTAGAAALINAKATPIYYKNPKPAYPAIARKRNWQGSVVLSILVLENGDVDGVTIDHSSGYELLDTSALTTVRTWRFLPGRENGQPVAMKVQVTVHFKLD